MNLLHKFKKNILYFFITIPLILVGYEFLMVTATGNRGWIFLLIGQIALIPLSFILLNGFTSYLTNSFWGNAIILGITITTLIILPTLIIQYSKDLYK